MHTPILPIPGEKQTPTLTNELLGPVFPPKSKNSHQDSHQALFLDTKSALAQSKMKMQRNFCTRLMHTSILHSSDENKPLTRKNECVGVIFGQIWPKWTQKPLLLARLRNGQSACNGFFSQIGCTHPFYPSQAKSRPQLPQTNFWDQFPPQNRK
jgi:hypothetical protein